MSQEEERLSMGAPADGLTPETREQIVARLEEAPVSLAILFGSYASGDATDGSDVDLAVAYEADDVTDTHLSLVADLTRILGHDDVDVVRLTTVDPRIAVDAIDTGQLLVGSADDAVRLRERLEDDRKRREKTVQSRVSDAERTIEQRLEQREHG